MSFVITDDILIQQCIAGEESFWGTFVDKYIGLVHSAVSGTMIKHCTAVVKSDVEDVCQDVFMKLINENCRLLKSFDVKKACFSTWITIVSRNTAIDHIRRRKQYTVSIDEVVDTLHIQHHFDPVKIDIPKGVLSNRQHLVLRMMYDDGLDVQSVAAYLDVKAQTVRSLHHRALKNLRNYYGLDTSRSSDENVVTSKG